MQVSFAVNCYRNNNYLNNIWSFKANERSGGQTYGRYLHSNSYFYWWS